MLGTALKDTPSVKDALVQLIKSAESIDVDAIGAVATRGLDVPEDLKVIADVQAFFLLFKNSFLPVVEAAYKEISADVKAPEAPTTTPAQ